MSRRQGERWAQQEQQPAEPQPQAQAAAPAEPDMVSQLKDLAALKDQGILTEEEFAAQKAKILAH